MPVLILLIILDLAIIGWVLYVGIRDTHAIVEGAHGIPDVKSPEVQAKIEPATAAVSAAPATPVDTRFIRAERGEQQSVSEPVQASSGEAVVQIRPPKPEEGGGNAGENA